jgi:wyosine [tRNA(Phe)-imidazoG37] synthetase (radical SAM superfamily)
MHADRHSFYSPSDIVAEVTARVVAVRESGERIDYLAFVPDGEPTLDVNLGREIRELKYLGIRVAVITNASLLWKAEVRSELAEADWVSLKVDAVDPQIWRALDRPHRALDLDRIKQGAQLFAQEFEGTLVTETMLVKGINDGRRHLDGVAGFVGELSPRTAYLSIPTRPPAQPSVRAPRESTLIRAYQTFSDHVDSVDCLVGYEGTAFASTGDPARDLLSITAVHPMREDAVRELLARTGADWRTVSSLIEDGQLVETRYQNSTFYLRRLRGT